MKIKTRKSTIL